MKIKTPFIVSLLATILIIGKASGQTNDVAKTALLSLASGVNQAKEIDLSIYPSFAPSITVNGVASKWGGGIAAMYPIADYTFAGVRLDYLGDQFWMPSVTVGLKADISILGKYTVTPFTEGGAIFPINGSTQDGNVGAIVGGGIKAHLWISADGKRSLDAFYVCEKWTLFQGVIHRPGLAFNLKF